MLNMFLPGCALFFNYNFVKNHLRIIAIILNHCSTLAPHYSINYFMNCHKGFIQHLHSLDMSTHELKAVVIVIDIIFIIVVVVNIDLQIIDQNHEIIISNKVANIWISNKIHN